jgi:peptidoglycan/xylan/chitin deacetylase (PgdA/CDA1 family)
MGLATADLSALPNLAPIVGYGIHVVASGEDLSTIAERGGSDAALIRAYNRTNALLAPGHPLIVPHLEGHSSSLPRLAFIVQRGNTAQPRAALTVDVEVGAIWHLLDVLRQRNARATFFVTGAWAQAHPDMLRQIVADGHELGNHSFSHPDFRLLSQAQIAWELAETERIVHKHTEATTRPFFRPPYGSYDNRVLLAVIEQGYLPVFWTIDSQDAVGAPKSPDFLAQQITGTFAPEQVPGTIALSHCCAARHVIADAVPAILDRFAAMGIETHTLSDVLGE